MSKPAIVLTPENHINSTTVFKLLSEEHEIRLQQHLNKDFAQPGGCLYNVEVMDIQFFLGYVVAMAKTNNKIDRDLRAYILGFYDKLPKEIKYIVLKRKATQD